MAALILMVSVVPVVRIFTTLFLSQQEMKREHQRAHIARAIHAKIVEAICRQIIPLNSMKKGMLIPLHLEEEALEEEIRQLRYRYEARLTVEKARKPRDAPQPNEFLLRLTLILQDDAPTRRETDDQESTYEYWLYIDAKKEGERTEEGEEEEAV